MVRLKHVPVLRRRPGVSKHWLAGRSPGNRHGIVVFSFGQRSFEDEPNPCNSRLAEAAAATRQQLGESTIVIAQWETARALDTLGVPLEYVVQARPGAYLDTADVWHEAEPLLRERGIRDIALIAHPYLHSIKARQLARLAGFRVIPVHVGHIGFDRSSSNQQPWTRSPCALTLYALRQLTTGRRGPA